jgi:hypothetical protein
MKLPRKTLTVTLDLRDLKPGDRVRCQDQCGVLTRLGSTIALVLLDGTARPVVRFVKDLAKI